MPSAVASGSTVHCEPKPTASELACATSDFGPTLVLVAPTPLCCEWAHAARAVHEVAVVHDAVAHDARLEDRVAQAQRFDDAVPVDAREMPDAGMLVLGQVCRERRRAHLVACLLRSGARRLAHGSSLRKKCLFSQCDLHNVRYRLGQREEGGLTPSTMITIRSTPDGRWRRCGNHERLGVSAAAAVRTTVSGVQPTRGRSGSLRFILSIETTAARARGPSLRS